MVLTVAGAGQKRTLDGVPGGIELLRGRVVWRLAAEALDDEGIELNHLNVIAVRVNHALASDPRGQRRNRGED